MRSIQLTELTGVHLQAGVVLVQDVLELGVILLDRLERIIQQTTQTDEPVGCALAVFDLNVRAETT